MDGSCERGVSVGTVGYAWPMKRARGGEEEVQVVGVLTAEDRRKRARAHAVVLSINRHKADVAVKSSESVIFW
eukprot:COSAG02_NODE_973_length_15536_cov_5.108635_7_plen_73_part_00